MANRENISINAVTVHNAMFQLMALPYTEKIFVDGKVYGILYSGAIIEALRLHKIGKRTLSDVLTELKHAELIECINPNSTPAYRFTEKTTQYYAEVKPNDGEIEANTSQKQKKKKPLFSLVKKTKFENLNNEYKKLLYLKTEEISKEKGLDHQITFEKFVDFHVSKGNSFANWQSAYRTWCRNAIKFEKGSSEMFQ